MQRRSAKKKLETLILTGSLLSGAVALSVLTVHGQGKRGSDSDRGSSRSSSSSSSRSSSSSSRSNTSAQSRSSGSSTGNSGSARSRGGDESRKRGGDNGSRNRERGVRSNPDSTSNSASSGNNSQAFNRDRDRERGGRDRDRDRDRDGDRNRHHRHRHGDRDRDRDRDRNWRYRETRVYQASNYGNYRYGSNAYDQGYHDGLYTGANDARRGQGYDPERSHFYKHGAGGFLSVFGSPASYSLAYRDGFLRGYNEGFQNYQNYFVGGRFHR